MKNLAVMFATAAVFVAGGLALQDQFSFAAGMGTAIGTALCLTAGSLLADNICRDFGAGEAGTFRGVVIGGVIGACMGAVLGNFVGREIGNDFDRARTPAYAQSQSIPCEGDDCSVVLQASFSR